MVCGEYVVALSFTGTVQYNNITRILYFKIDIKRAARLHLRTAKMVLSPSVDTLLARKLTAK